MSEGKVIPFARKHDCGRDGHRWEKDGGEDSSIEVCIVCHIGHLTDEEAPELVYDSGTGLYDIMLSGCVVYRGLDPVGLREKIRQAVKP